MAELSYCNVEFWVQVNPVKDVVIVPLTPLAEHVKVFAPAMKVLLRSLDHC